MIKKLETKNILFLFTLFALLFSGCGDKKEDESKKTNVQAAASKPQADLKIEVVENKNAKAIKVKEKATDKTQSKSYYYDYNIESKYDENSKPANEDAAVRVKPRTAVEANMNIRSPYERVQISLLVKKLSKNFIIKCSACHDDYANGVIGPSLLDKDSDYIFDSIAKYKTGEKNNPLMTDLVKRMPDKEIRAIADEIYSFNKKIKKIRK